MLTTAIAVFAALALLLPGFIVAEAASARGARSSRSDLELALRALSYALLLHLVFSWWTVLLVRRVGPINEWRDHVSALSLYAAVVLLFVPLTVGVLLNIVLARAERRDGPMPLWAATLGAGEARDAFDFAFQRSYARGAWVIVELVGHTPGAPRLVGGRFGRASAVGQTPSAHDIYLEQLCIVREDVDGLRELVSATEPSRGLYVPASQIARIEILPPAGDTL
jgi:hypothetical protein